MSAKACTKMHMSDKIMQKFGVPCFDRAKTHSMAAAAICVWFNADAICGIDAAFLPSYSGVIQFVTVVAVSN